MKFGSPTKISRVEAGLTRVGGGTGVRSGAGEVARFAEDSVADAAAEAGRGLAAGLAREVRGIWLIRVPCRLGKVYVRFDSRTMYTVNAQREPCKPAGRREVAG